MSKQYKYKKDKMSLKQYLDQLEKTQPRIQPFRPKFIGTIIRKGFCIESTGQMILIYKGHNGKRMLLYRKYAVVYSRKEAEQHLKNYLEWCEDSGKKGNFF